MLVLVEEVEQDGAEGVLVDAEGYAVRFLGRGGQLGDGQPGGQDPDGRGDVAPCQEARSVRAVRSRAGPRSSTAGRPSMRGSAVWANSLPSVSTRPGASGLRVSDSLRSMEESAGSFRRSSTRVPNIDWVAIRTSFQRNIPATTWMP